MAPIVSPEVLQSDATVRIRKQSRELKSAADHQEHHMSGSSFLGSFVSCTRLSGNLEMLITEVRSVFSCQAPRSRPPDLKLTLVMIRHVALEAESLTEHGSSRSIYNDDKDEKPCRRRHDAKSTQRNWLQGKTGEDEMCAELSRTTTDFVRHTTCTHSQEEIEGREGYRSALPSGRAQTCGRLAEAINCCRVSGR
ncbi:hypothetical protein B0T21DRAFT_345322 [Apiosordaria backusii]|uniref:Uncharacterized protein n=1 Tax=Apiosordaria backusii TaxID=314023 RepID=A0AA40ETK1_9PEZI|nr:hypothetical protein B0T21DRAFT_345322 [Apiosordaria backusii]